MAGAVHVRHLKREDISWAIALTDTEAWGYAAADFERLLDLEPEGVFLAQAGGARVGITATTTYGPLAYIGAVIVEPGWRGKHVGDALMRACLDFLDLVGAEVPSASTRARGTVLHLTGRVTEIRSQAVLDGASYIGVGPTFPSKTKAFQEFSGLELVRQAHAEIRLPAFVIGGIDLDRLPEVLAAGGRRVAVSSAVCAAADPCQAALEFRRRLESNPP